MTKRRVIEALLALWFLFTSYGVLNSRIDGYELLLVGFGLFYFTTAFAVARRLRWARYLVYLNLLLVLLSAGFVLNLAGSHTIPRLLVPISVAVFATIYCHRTLRGEIQSISATREAFFFAIALAAYIGALAIASLFTEPTVRTKSGPIMITNQK